jgi:hypothetical protein
VGSRVDAAAAGRTSRRSGNSTYLDAESAGCELVALAGRYRPIFGLARFGLDTHSREFDSVTIAATIGTHVVTVCIHGGWAREFTDATDFP